MEKRIKPELLETMTHYAPLFIGDLALVIELQDIGFGEFKAYICKLENTLGLKGQALIDQLLKNKILETTCSISQLRMGVRELRKTVNSLLDLMFWNSEPYAYEE